MTDKETNAGLDIMFSLRDVGFEACEFHRLDRFDLIELILEREKWRKNEK